MTTITFPEVNTADAKAVERQMQLARQLDIIIEHEKKTMMLCKRSGLVEGYRWRETATRDDGKPLPTHSSIRKTPAPFTHHRNPPLPFHSFKHLGPGHCRVCGQPIYGAGDYRKTAVSRHKRDSLRTWHEVCTSTFFLMTKPNNYAAVIAYGQQGLCAISGEPIAPPARDYLGHADVDHEVPLFRVARDHADEPWYELLRFWTLPNLRAITNAAHLIKNREEARERAGYRAKAVGQEAML